MALSLNNIFVDQETLGQKIRPYQVPGGDNDDKSVFPVEFVRWGNEYGLEGIHRVNGSIEKLKLFTANGFTVIVRTWLHSGEDIGHYRIVRGYDDGTKTILQDDSFEGPNINYSYETLEDMWRPFNYEYVVLYPKEKEDLVMAILGEEQDEKIAYKNAIKRAENELTRDEVFASLNLVRSYYHQGEFEKAITLFEQIESRLPPRTLWYHLEPFQMYQKAGKEDPALAMIEMTLSNYNRAFAELYVIRGTIYKTQGKIDAARSEFETALFYNQNYTEARQELSKLGI
jgi:tetratricopeptide (TPR) repeat protein